MRREAMYRQGGVRGCVGDTGVSEATWQLVRDQFECEAMGANELRGHSRMRTYTISCPTTVATAG